MKNLIKKYHITPIFSLLLTLIFFYFPVLFFGQTLQAPEMARMDVNFKSAPSITNLLSGKIPPQIFNVEQASAAYNYFPLDVTLGQIYRSKNLPLWNPYQGLGAPFAAEYDTAAFFPLRFIQVMLPISTRDWFFVMQIWLAGIFTYFFFTIVGIDRVSAFFGASLYVGSGLFSWYFQLNDFLDVATVLPPLMIATHLLSKKVRKLYIGFLGIASALMLYAGQPEPEFYSFVLAGCYFIFQIFSIKNTNSYRFKQLSCFLIGIILALLAASPLLLLFIQFCEQAYTFHTHIYKNGLAHMTGTLNRTDPFLIKGIFFPKLLDWANTPQIVSVSEAWEKIGGYIGVTALYFIVMGVSIKSSFFRKDIIFFVVFGISFLLMNMGIWPFVWVGYLPIFKLAWSPKWGGAAWSFALITAATYGFYTAKQFNINDSKINSYTKKSLYITCLILYLIIVTTYQKFYYTQGVFIYTALYNPTVQAIICSIFATFSLSLITYFQLRYRENTSCWIACVLILIVELQYCLPKGNYLLPQFFGHLNLQSNYIITQIIYLLISLGFLLSIFFYVSRKKLQAVLLGTFFVIFSIVLSQQTYPGYPKYQHVERPQAYIKFLQENSKYDRIFGLNGILDPFYASIYKLNDIRIIATMSIKTYQNYMQNYIMEPIDTALSTTFITHFIPGWQLSTNSDYTVKFRSTLARALDLFGVKYIIAPNKPNENWIQSNYPNLATHLKQIYSDQFVNIYQNTQALQRAFIVTHYQFANSYQNAQMEVMKPDFDMRNVAVLEKNVPIKSKANVTLSASAEITKYEYGKVIINTNSNADGLLVFTDIYYPGWHASIDGEPTEIYRVDGLVRGILVPTGNHIIQFYYSPILFKIGVILMFFALMTCGLLCFKVCKKNKGVQSNRASKIV